eukprot:Transcript_23383.p2 GENE.Transcript_23383~~Transcript_23383.p2  ORF type:complete len:298 (+),score=160.81 Transcript_23383:70-963(+)
MPKGKKRKEREAAAAAAAAEAEEDDYEAEEPPLELQAGDEDPEELQVEFGFYDPRPEDYHSMRALLSGGALLPSGIDPGGFADLLSEQAAVGTLVKGESIDTDLYGFISALSLQQHSKVKCVQQLTASILQRIPDAPARETVRAWLSDARAPLGLVVSERFVNMPPQLLPNLVDALVQDIDWAVQNSDVKAERDAFRFQRLLLLAPIRMAPPAAGKAKAAAAEPPRKQGKQAKRGPAAAALPEGAEFDRVEEECVAQTAEAAYLLNGTGRVRQMLLVLRLDGVRAAVPKLHAMLGTA